MADPSEDVAREDSAVEAGVEAPVSSQRQRRARAVPRRALFRGVFAWLALVGALAATIILGLAIFLIGGVRPGQTGVRQIVWYGPDGGLLKLEVDTRYTQDAHAFGAQPRW